MLFKEIQAHAGGNLVKRGDVFNGCDVEAAEPIGMQVLAHENGELEEAVFQDVHRVPGCREHVWILPNLRIKLFLRGTLRQWLEEFHVLVSLLKNIDCNNACTSRKLRRSIIQK